MDAQLFSRGPLVRVPELTEPQHAILCELEILDCRPWVVAPGRQVGRPLRWLIAAGCVEVMGVNPGVYRVTRLGRLARSAGVRKW